VLRPVRRRLAVVASLTACAVAGATLTALPAQAVPSADVVVSELYGGGGNSGATLTRDFIELHNRGSEPVDVTGWSVQYARASGVSWQRTALSGTIQPDAHYLVAEAEGSGGTEDLPAPDATGTIAMAGSSGKVALVTNAALLACGTDCDARSDLGVRDFVGYGSANDSETAPTAGLSNTTSASRDAAGTDTDDNSTDFAVGAPDPQNGGGEEPPPPPTAQIAEIQGAAHRSPLLGDQVSDVDGVVVQRTSNGFWMQDATSDADVSTSDGLFVFTSSAPASTITRGTAVSVSGTVGEFRPGGSSGSNLSTTQIGSADVTVGTAVGLPDAVLVGAGGRTPPGEVIDDDAPTVTSRRPGRSTPRPTASTSGSRWRACGSGSPPLRPWGRPTASASCPS